MVKKIREKLTTEMIGEQVYLWSLRFRETFLTPEEIEILSSEYLEDLESENVSVKQFRWAAKHASKRCRFFPKMADILDAVDMYRANPPKSDCAAISYTPIANATPEQEETGKRAAEIAAYAIKNKIPFEEAQKRFQ